MNINPSEHEPYELPSHLLLTGKLHHINIQIYVLQSFKNIYPTDCNIRCSAVKVINLEST